MFRKFTLWKSNSYLKFKFLHIIHRLLRLVECPYDWKLLAELEYSRALLDASTFMWVSPFLQLLHPLRLYLFLSLWYHPILSICLILSCTCVLFIPFHRLSTNEIRILEIIFVDSRLHSVCSSSRIDNLNPHGENIFPRFLWNAGPSSFNFHYERWDDPVHMTWGSISPKIC